MIIKLMKFQIYIGVYQIWLHWMNINCESFLLWRKSWLYTRLYNIIREFPYDLGYSRHQRIQLDYLFPWSHLVIFVSDHDNPTGIQPVFGLLRYLHGSFVPFFEALSQLLDAVSSFSVLLDKISGEDRFFLVIFITVYFTSLHKCTFQLCTLYTLGQIFPASGSVSLMSITWVSSTQNKYFRHCFRMNVFNDA